MWAGDRIYFLSDREGPVTLFYYDTKTNKITRAIANHGLDFKSASAGPGAIVYEQFGELHLYDLKTGQTKAVAVTLAGDLPELRPHYVNVAKRLRNADISPNGARAVFEARGEILTVPAEKGDPRNLTNSTTAMEREPVWSPDGQNIAYLSDESGEYALDIVNEVGTAKRQRSRWARRATPRRDGRRTARRSPTWTTTVTCSTWTSQRRSQCWWRLTITTTATAWRPRGRRTASG
jgi:tricorn protease